MQRSFGAKFAPREKRGKNGGEFSLHFDYLLQIIVRFASPLAGRVKLDRRGEPAFNQLPGRKVGGPANKRIASCLRAARESAKLKERTEEEEEE